MANNWIKTLNSAMRGYHITKIDRYDISPDNFILYVTFDGIIISDVPMTIKQLSVEIKNLAVEMNKRFDQVDKRLDGHDAILKEYGEILKEHSEIFKRNNLK